VPTSQNGQRRVQMSPMIMNVAGALAEALADVRARRFLAHGVQVVLAQDLLDLEEARAAAGAHADPVGLLQPLGRTILIGIREVLSSPRSLTPAMAAVGAVGGHS
jgi:hypothetical protein